MGQTHNPIMVSIRQFYGIEINDFAVSVARTALWIAESQMMKETEDIVNMNLDFFPLTNYPNIVEGNSLRLNWEDIVPKNELNYIMGNPPFVGARLMTKSQKEDMELVFGRMKGLGNLDYVSAWYKKACQFIDKTKISCAFVSTNSIAQGEQVDLLWEPLFDENNIVINFAYQTFIWNSEASSKAHVHCVIIGFSNFPKADKYIFASNNMVKKVNHINAYLVEAPDIFISTRRSPICQVPEMLFGSMPNDGGNLILEQKDNEELLKTFPDAEVFVRKFLGSKEFINKLDRWCIWITPENLKDFLEVKPIVERIEKVKEHRLKSDRKATNELANYPYRFGEVRQPESDYLLVPAVSSENRKYIPIGYEDKDTIASNAVLIIPDAETYNFAVICSNVHMAWMKVVAGRLKSDYKYSASIVYNNFPWPELTEVQKEKLNNTGQEILNARSLYKDWSYADLYNDLIMPPELRKAHQENDKAVMDAYGFDWRTMTESECVAELMKLYQKSVE